MPNKTSNRRDFLRLAAAGALAVPAAGCYAAYRAAQGDPFPLDRSPASGGARENAASRRPSAEPILLLTSERAPNPFGTYLGEILRAEGLNCFGSLELSALTAPELATHDIVLLGEAPVNAAQTELLERFVFQGGQLVCMRPDRRLARLLGIETLAYDVSERYMMTAADHPVADGITRQSLQYHGTADAYRLAGARAVAWLSTASGQRSEYPAVTVNDFGRGRAAMWAFDLARSVALMRQGNPAWSNQDRDGLNGARTVDLLAGWVDLDRIEIPQADEQQRLLANLLSALSEGARPLPRLWYFPGRSKGVLVATGDSHMNPDHCIEEVLTEVERRDGHVSIYYSPQLVSTVGRAERRVRFFLSDRLPVMSEALARWFESPTPQMVARWRSRGHEFTVHPWVESGLVNGWRRYWREFTGRGYGPVGSTVRTHRILWSGWAETARAQAACGIGMNLDYYAVGPSLKKATGEWVCGHLTGSGLPMKFVDERGQLLHIYQQDTQLTDEHLLALDVPGWGGWPDLSAEDAVEVSRALLRRSTAPGGHSAIAAQFHVDPFQVGGETASKARTWLTGTLDAAVELGVPIWSAQEWLRFTDARHSAAFADVAWLELEKRVHFHLEVPAEGPHELTVLIPFRHDGRVLTEIEVDGQAVPVREHKVGGVVYASIVTNRRRNNVSATYALS